MTFIDNLNSQDLLSPGVPQGFTTVAAWWVTRMPQAFELLEDPLKTLAEEEARVALRSNEVGAEVRLVAASPRARALGRRFERAYPEVLLAEFYPVNV